MDSSDLRILERRGWSDQKAKVFRETFFEFLANCYIDSKDLGGHICLGDHIYYGQVRVIDDILDGLKRDIHDFYDLKSRQLGHTTIFRAFDIFYLGTNAGLRGATVMDTDTNKKTGRAEIESMIDNLPASIKFPRFKGHDRDALTLENGSRLQFFAAGVKKSKSSGTLGRSVGLSMAHLSEICSYDNDDGLEAFVNSLSDINPDRLYIWESTARGYNTWNEIYKEAKEDTHHKKCIFYGWWSKDSQKIERDDPDFSRYGIQEPTEKELEKINLVRDRYDWQITPEQLAWVRKKMDPTAKREDDDDLPVEYIGSTIRLQEQPWIEEDAWQTTGATFFASENLKDLQDKFASTKYKGYWFSPGLEFIDMNVYPAHTIQQAELKVWEEPQIDAVYVIAADVAHGYDENNDRSAIQVLRCYADGCDQVAEYASPLVTTQQFAWVIMSLAAWYAENRGDVYLIVELNGPGASVWDEIRSLRTHLLNGYQTKQVDEKGLRNAFMNVKNYVYSRPDGMGAGHNWQWKTSGGAGPSGKVRLMERLRDFVSNMFIHIRSADTIEEMRWVTREGDTIEAKGTKKDDRVMALAMGIRCWEERARKALSAQKMTREADMAKRRLTIIDQSKLFHANMLSSVFAQKRVVRSRDAALLRRMQWRGR
jgi:hypothetical protein